MQLSSIKAKMTGAVFLLVLFLTVLTVSVANLYYEPLSEAYAPIYTARHYFMIGGITAAILSALLIWAVMNYLMSPLTQLTEHIRALSHGAGDQKPATVITNDEIGELSQAFKSMYTTHGDYISGIKSVKESLRASEFKYRTLHQSLMDGFAVMDQEGKILEYNEAFREMLNYSNDELPALTNSDITPRHWHDPERNLMNEQVLMRGYSDIYEKEYRKKDGTIFPVELRTTLLKNQSDDTTGVWVIVRDITARKEAEKMIRNALSMLSATLDATEDGILVRDLEFRKILFNKKFSAMWRIPDAIVQVDDEKQIRAFILDQLKHPAKFLAMIEKEQEQIDYESCDILELKDGRTFERVSRPQRLDDVMVGRVASYRDITERKNLEAQLRQAQKLEAIGTLAGGIAHDFNNILTVIVASASLLQRRLDDESPLRRQVDRIFSAAERASGLTQGLLAYSRNQVSNPVPIRINLIVESFFSLLSRLVPENIDFTLSLSDLDPFVKADRGQIDQVLMNFVSNAVDAMSDGGNLIIRTDQVIVDQEFITIHGHGSPGRFAVISVEDSGTGMDEKIRERIFEPFFTTKEVGKGTGLGLATVYGIVQQHHGEITVQSEPGKGTTFNVYFPAVGAPDAGTMSAPARPALPWGDETILLVEDELSLRTFVCDLLQRCGYTVREAESGPAALKIWSEQRDHIQLVLTDIIMPENLNGIDLGRRLLAEKPSLKVIYMSGYTGNLEGRHNTLVEGVNFIRKPFKPEVIAEIIRKKLDDRTAEK